MEKDQARKEDLRCSFCRKDQRDVGKLIAGPEVYICDECVQLCLEVIENDHLSTEINGQDISPSGTLPMPCSLCGVLTPSDGALLVKNRGLLCPMCVQEVQSAIAESDER